MKQKSYIIDNKELMSEWDWAANADLDPAILTYGSHKKAHWKCSKGHKWTANISDRACRNRNCPYCNHHKLLFGFNDLATTHPEIAKEWNYEKNFPLTPQQYITGSNKKVWWKCSKSHEWEAKISNRVYLSRGCPYCGHHKVLAGFNDLATIYPEIAKEWNYEKNSPLLPTQVFSQSAKKVWWLCPKGHEYQTTISNRRLSGCPVCSKEQQTSFPEQAIFYYLFKYNQQPENRYRIYGIECDVFLKDKNISIEYDGGRFHQNIKKDINKIKKLNGLGIKTINIREPKCPEIELDDAIIYQRENKTEKDLEKAIKFIFSNIDNTLEPDINIERDRTIILQNALSIEKKNSLANLNPTLLREWNYEKNGKLKPEFFTISSGKKVWWKCAKGHEWVATIHNRSFLNRNCPYCSNQKVLPGYNDLVTTNPEIAKEWNYEKNGALLPTQYTAGSNKKFWWKCANGHEWRVSINNRTRGIILSGKQKGSQCPYCINQKVQPGFNDLATTHPEIAKEWNYEKNGQLLPTQITAGSNKKVWWKCNKGHEWRAMVASRQKGTGCPYCLNHNINPGENDLASQYPEFLKEWDYEKNAPLLPTQIGSGSQKTVWWICSKCGKKWKASICNRVKHNLNCRNCNIRESKRNKNQLKFEF